MSAKTSAQIPHFQQGLQAADRACFCAKHSRLWILGRRQGWGLRGGGACCMGAHGGGAAAVHLDDVQEAVVHRAVGQVGIADARGAPRGRRLHRHNIPSLIVNKRTLNVSSSSSFPPEGQALKTASKVHQQGHSSGRRVGGSRSGSCLASQCRPQGEASRTRAAAPTCAGGVAFGGRVVPGGMTLWPTWVVVTAVQLLVKDMGAVFSRTCISQQCTHHLPRHAGLDQFACSPDRRMRAPGAIHWMSG